MLSVACICGQLGHFHSVVLDPRQKWEKGQTIKITQSQKTEEEQVSWRDLVRALRATSGSEDIVGIIKCIRLSLTIVTIFKFNAQFQLT